MLSPGRTPEPDGSSEIEVNLDLDAGQPGIHDYLRIRMSRSDDPFVGRPGGLDLNGDGDLDVVTKFVAWSLSVFTDAGSDTVTMTGSDGTGEPFPFANVQAVYLGPGRDAATLAGISPAPGGVVNGGAGDDVMRTHGGGWQFGGGYGDDVLVGGSGDDDFDGDSGSDTIKGRGGDDDIVQIGREKDPDLFSGGRGADGIWYNTLGRGVSISLDGIANDGVRGQDNVAADVEGVSTVDGDDVIIGNGTANRLSGERGNDTIIGSGGPDELYGRAGDDDIAGGAGRDVLFGGPNHDVFHTADGELDRIRGGKGVDTATDRDSMDWVHDVEAF